MNRVVKISSTSASGIGEWVRVNETPRMAEARTTVGISAKDVVLIPGRLVRGRPGSAEKSEVQLSIEPRSVSRKLAIRRLNDQMEGRSIPSTTLATKNVG
jgi:hypothetical protein